MRVLCDYQILVRQSTGGVSRYHYELLKNINILKNDVLMETLCLFSRNYYFRKYFGRDPYNYSNKKVRNIVLILNDLCTFFKVLFIGLFGKRYDIVHVTWYKPFYIKILKRIMLNNKPKVVMTVHDLIHEMLSEKDPIMKRGAYDREKMLKISDEVIAISNNTKKDLLYYYPWVDERKISVVYHGFPEETLGESKPKNMPNDFVFFVGQRSSYKNFSTFIRAMGILHKKIKKLYIVCAGGGAFTEKEQKIIKEAGLVGLVSQKFMTDEELVYCYRHARCFVFPSLYEGFGMPILEAFYYDCPVVLSNASCFPEIAGDAGIYFDGMNVDDIAEKIEMVYKMNDVERTILIKKGHDRLHNFSWNKAAKETVAIYKKAINDASGEI